MARCISRRSTIWPTPILPDNYRLGHGTDWTDDQAGPVRGIGQRVFLAGDDAYPIMEIAELSFAE